jgi:hypothetical protein
MTLKESHLSHRKGGQWVLFDPKDQEQKEVERLQVEVMRRWGFVMNTQDIEALRMFLRDE